jgi:hypothetical protein
MSIVTQQDSTVKLFASTWVTNEDVVDCIWNVMAHAQKPDFVSRRNEPVNLNWRGHQFSRPLATVVCASAVIVLDTPCSEVEWRVLATHSIRQFPLLCVSVCHQISTGLYHSTPTSMAVKNGWSCAYIPQYLFMAQCFIRERELHLFMKQWNSHDANAALVIYKEYSLHTKY